jgi:hypothetical protein
MLIIKLVVAAQLLFTVGVTCALAFELPSKPLAQITQELREHLQKKLHPEKYTTTTEAASINDTDSEDESHSGEMDVTMMDPHRRMDFNYNGLNYINGKQNYYDTINKHNYYYKDKYLNYKTKISNKSDNLSSKNSTTTADSSESIWKKVIRK